MRALLTIGSSWSRPSHMAKTLARLAQSVAWDKPLIKAYSTGSRRSSTEGVDRERHEAWMAAMQRVLEVQNQINAELEVLKREG